MNVTDDPTAVTGWQCERWMDTPKAESSADAERLRADKKDRIRLRVEWGLPPPNTEGLMRSQPL